MYTVYALQDLLAQPAKFRPETGFSFAEDREGVRKERSAMEIAYFTHPLHYSMSPGACQILFSDVHNEDGCLRPVSHALSGPPGLIPDGAVHLPMAGGSRRCAGEAQPGSRRIMAG